MPRCNRHALYNSLRHRHTLLKPRRQRALTFHFGRLRSGLRHAFPRQCSIAFQTANRWDSTVALLVFVLSRFAFSVTSLPFRQYHRFEAHRQDRAICQIVDLSLLSDCLHGNSSPASRPNIVLLRLLFGLQLLKTLSRALSHNFANWDARLP